MAVKCYVNGQWINLSKDKIKYYDGKQWLTVTNIKYYDGSQWKPLI